MSLAIIALAGFAAAALIPWVAPRGRAGGWLVAAVPAALFVWLLTYAGDVHDGETPSVAWEWVPALGIDFAFRLDGLSLLMGLVITGVGTLVFLYAHAYLDGRPRWRYFQALMLAFMASMLGLVLADDAISLSLFWELTSVSSYLLIVFESGTESQRAGHRAFFITTAGGLAVLAALLLIGNEAGTYRLSELPPLASSLQEATSYLPILILVALGVATKSAQLPFHFWLPGAMVAPTPVSAYLHSATMVNAGVYLLARFNPILGGTTEWTAIFVCMGAATAIVGAFLAFQQYDLKLILAYSTIGALGIFVALIGLSTAAALQAAMAFLVAHALYKGGLFLVAGSIDHGYGTRDIRDLGGIGRRLPWITASLVLAGIAFAGLPPALAFVAKEAAFDAALDAGGWGLLATAGVAVGAAFFVTSALVLAQVVPDRPVGAGEPHALPFELQAPPLLLGVAAVAAIFLPGIGSYLVDPAAAASAEGEVHGLSLWHGVNLPLALSAAAIVAGALVFWGLDRLRRPAGAVASAAGALRPSYAYETAMVGMLRFAVAQRPIIQHGYLRHYLSLMVFTGIAIVTFSVVSEGITNVGDMGSFRIYEVVAVLLVFGAGLLAVTSRSRLAAVAGLAGVGFGVAILYAFFGAPDLAMTQFLVETLLVLLFVLVFYRLPAFTSRSSRTTRTRDILLCGAVGGLVTLLVLAASSPRPEGVVGRFYGDIAEPEAFGRNVVNVILTDFRALDTLGEITVLVIAGLGVLSLLRLGRGGSE